MQPDELTRTCRFETARLDVAAWHAAPVRTGESLADVVAALLTPRTTRSLPPSWRGEYDALRAATWIRERDSESAVLIASDRETRRPVGLMILYEAACNDNPGLIDIRLGYLLDEQVWGRGLGTELVGGLVEWCRSSHQVRSIAGGVEHGNVASTRVLASNGFVPVGSAAGGEQLYELLLLPDAGH